MVLSEHLLLDLLKNDVADRDVPLLDSLCVFGWYHDRKVDEGF